MEIFFMDVGQGSCNIIHLGRRRAIIIDTGGSGPLLLRTIKQLKIESFPHVILTHSHDDHAGAAGALVDSYADSIGSLWLINDPDLYRYPSEVMRAIEEAIKDKRLRHDQLLPARLNDIITITDPSLSIKVLGPSFIGNLNSFRRNDPNITSLILDCEADGIRTIFTGDSKDDEWARIVEDESFNVNCDIVVAPHHGGDVGSTNICLKHLKYKYCVFSYGASNNFGHPKESVIEIAADRSKVLCTQMTRKCCMDREACRSMHPGLPEPGQSLLKKTLTKKKNSTRVPCFGTIRVEVKNGELNIPSAANHEAHVKEVIARFGKTLCAN